MTQRVDKDSLPLNQPRRTPSHPTKSHIVKTKVDGKEKIIRFGEQGASTAGKPKEGESDRMKAKRASFKSRHAKNIAKGPSSPAYWANKVKWADGGFVRTNYAAGDSVRVQPQNAALGAIARALQGTHDFVSKPFGYENPPVQMLSELIGLPATARTVERMSYGQPITNINKANVPLLPDDTAEAALTVAPMAGPLAKYAKRVGTNLVQTAPYVARDIVESATSPLKSYAVKPKGGNWAPPVGTRDSVTMSVSPIKRNPDVISGDMINAAAGEDLWSKMVDMDVYQHPSSWLRENRPEVLNKLVGEEKGAVNKWLDNKLEKYIRNDMGTPDDPIRLAHEQGYSHIPGEAEELGMWLPEDVAAMRVKAGYPEEGFAVKRHADAGYPENMEVNSRKAEMWEALADAEITASPAGAYQEQARMARDMPNFVPNGKQAVAMAERNPWIEKLDRETPIYKIDRPMDLNENLGFKHMADEIENMLDPESGLPAALRMTPQQLDKVSMKQMVEKVDAVNKWRAEEASKAELGDMMGNLTATPRMQIPDTQLSFVKEPGMKWVDIPDTVGGEGMKLCTTIGKQAGWCTQGEGLAERYGSGENRLTTLLDAEGRPHAQAMLKVMANDQDTGAMFSRNIATLLAQRGVDNAEEVATQLSRGYKRQQSKKVRDMLPEIEEEARRMIPADLRLPKPDITELKPVGNTFNSERASEYAKRDPQYKEKITDSVLKFLNAGEWGTVKDLHHYDIVDLLDTSSVQKALKDVLDYDLPHERIDKFNYAVNFNPESPRFMNERQFRDFVDPTFGREGYAEGGSVMKTAAADLMKFLDAQGLTMADLAAAFGKRGLPLSAAFYSGDLGKDEDLELRARRMQKPTITEAKYAEGGSVSYDPTQVDHIMNSIATPRLAEGGSVDAPDLEFSEDPEAMRLYKHAMKQVASGRSDSSVGAGMSGRVAGGELSAGFDMNRMAQDERDQLMKALAANYNTNLGDVNVNARVQKPLDAKDIYAGMLNGSIPLGTGRAMLGVQGMKTPQGMGVTGYNAGWSGQVGPGNLSANVNVPKRGGRSAQMQYQIPFAEGGSVSAYDPNRVDAILNEIM